MTRITALLILLVPLAGCICTDIGCRDGISLTLVDANGAWADGDYRFTFTTPSGTQRVTCKLTRANNPPATCDRGGDIDPDVFPDAQWRFHVGGAPASVRVTVERNGAQLGEQSVAPEYQDHQPNGQYCAPTCRESAHTITL